MQDDKICYLKEFYTLEQLSKEVSIAIPSLRNFIKSGDLKASKVGNRYVITREQVKTWLENNRAN